MESIDLCTPGQPEDQAVTIDLTQKELEVLKVVIRLFDLQDRGMTDKQLRRLLKWINDPMELVRLTPRNINIYARQREGQHNEKDWWLTCDLDVFLKAWPKIWKIVWADDVVISALNDEAFHLECIAYPRPEEFLAVHVQRAAAHLAQTQFVRRGPGFDGWLIDSAEIDDPEVCSAFYMGNLRNPAIAPFMSSTDANGAVTAARAGFDMAGGPMLRAKAALDAHIVVLLVESSRRKEHWPELDNDWVHQQVRRLTNESAAVRWVFDHFGVFDNYPELRRSLGEVFAAGSNLVTEAELTFWGRVACLENALKHSSLDRLDEVFVLLQPFLPHGR